MNVLSRNHNGPLNTSLDGPDRFDIMGVGVVNARPEVAIDTIDQQLSLGHRIKLAFLNAHGSNIAAYDNEFRSCLDRFMVLNDGVGVGLAARLLHGKQFEANLNGTDFVPLYLGRTRHRFRIFLLGGRPGIAERAGAAIIARGWPHEVAGHHDGYFSEADIPQVLAAVRASGADLLLVALGNPQQEKFVERHFSAFNCEVAICVGALFDFLAGAVPRAPRLMRHAGLEWLFRLAVEPKRLWRRYLIGNALFITRLLRSRLIGALPVGPAKPGFAPGELAGHR